MAINKLRPFKLWVLQNFPFIAEDFDALTNYELMCKIVEYLNNVINVTNEQTLSIQELEKSFNDLKDYIDNYFENLDVQEEINNKLDEMAESGELQEIIIAYLNLNGVLAYNTVADLKSATNIIDGSFTKTFGKITYNDGYGAFYKIRTLTSGDVIDEDNILSLSVSDTLIAEKMIDKNLEDLKDEFDDFKDEVIEELNNKQDYFNLKVCQNIIMDINSSYLIQGSCIDENNNLYVYAETSYPYGNLYKFDISTHTLLDTITSVKLYHGNGLTIKDNKIYSCCFYGETKDSFSKKISIYNLSNNTQSEITPFENVTASRCVGICDYDEDHLLVMLSSQTDRLISNTLWYLLDITDNSISQLTFNFDSRYNNYYPGSVLVDIEKIEDHIYLLTGFQNCIYDLIIKDNTIRLSNVFKLDLYDDFGLPFGEFEGISKINGTGINKYNLIIESTISINNSINSSITDGKTLKIYNINVKTNLPYNYNSNSNEQSVANQGNIIYVNKNADSSSLLETGTQTNPFREIGRAISCLNNKKGYRAIFVTDNGTYNIGQQTKKEIIINIGNNTPTFYCQTFTQCNVAIYNDPQSSETSYCELIYNSNNIITLSNSRVFLLHCNITGQLYVRRGSHLRVYISTIDGAGSESAIYAREQSEILGGFTSITNFTTYAYTLVNGCVLFGTAYEKGLTNSIGGSAHLI